jgi:hypothetical protein
MTEMRRVQYKHTFIHGDDEPREGSLLTFLYDIPYFPPCGVFPPFHLLNQHLSTGGSDGGMSPGAIWEPFLITSEEYTQLIEALESTPLDEIRPHAHYAFVKPFMDHELDGFQDYFEWLMAAGKKHGARYRKEALERVERRESEKWRSS